MTHIPKGHPDIWNMVEADRFFFDIVNYFKEIDDNAQFLVHDYSENVHHPHHEPTYSSILAQALLAVMDSPQSRRLVELHVASRVPAAAKNYARVHDTNLPRLLGRHTAVGLAELVPVPVVIQQFVQMAGEERFTEEALDVFTELNPDISDEELKDFMKGYYRAVYYALRDPLVQYLISTHVAAQFSTPHKETD